MVRTPNLHSMSRTRRLAIRVIVHKVLECNHGIRGIPRFTALRVLSDAAKAVKTPESSS